jgi:hypothetical protein
MGASLHAPVSAMSARGREILRNRG